MTMEPLRSNLTQDNGIYGYMLVAEILMELFIIRIFFKSEFTITVKITLINLLVLLT
jgi:hypothetical protein